MGSLWRAADLASAGYPDQRGCGHGAGRRYGDLPGQAQTTPVLSTTVTVSRVSGDADLTVQSGASLVFKASNWNIYQTVTLRAAEDADQINGSAIIRCGASGLANKDVTVTEQDNGGIVNLALASHGSTITGDNGANWSKLIDGITTGYTGNSGFGYTTWSPTPGKMTLDLKGPYAISSMKLLLWDTDSRYYRYKIEASSNNTTWVTITDRTATTNQCRSWQNISFSPAIQARYLRLTGTYNSITGNNGFHVVEWEVYGAIAAGVGNAGIATTLTSLNFSASLAPWVWTSGNDSDEYPSDNLIDGDTNTLWIGNVTGSPWRVILDLGAVKDIRAVDVLFQDAPWTNLGIVGSRDSEVWFNYLAETNEWTPLRYLHINFRGDEHGAKPPTIREIYWLGK